ncbi:MAG: hypothetical protein C5B55_02925 [Blastocatellia bacterium]|nr:MAG: hypothetical protein C5B55_02925 [Blastocatellia bacterium]
MDIKTLDSIICRSYTMSALLLHLIRMILPVARDGSKRIETLIHPALENTQFLFINTSSPLTYLPEASIEPSQVIR